jgi:hypothetical protein
VTLATRPIPVLVAVVAALLFGAGDAGAQKKKDKAAPKDAPKPEEAASDEALRPTPGECVYQGQGIKICATKDRKGVYDVKTFPPASVTIEFEDPVEQVTQADKDAFAIGWKEGGNKVTIKPKRKDLPERTPLVITTSQVTVTISLRPSDVEKVDTQVQIIDPDRSWRDAEVERRVNELRTEDERKLKEKEAQLEKRAEARAEALLLEDLAKSDAEVKPTGTKPARNDAFIVLRTKHVVRVGQRRWLVFTVENRSDRPFEVRDIYLWLQTGGAETPLKAPWKMASTTIAVGDEVRGVVAVPGKVPPKGARLRLRVEETDPDRSVEQSGIGGL